MHAWLNLPIDAFPDISPTQAKVILKIPGMTPEEIEHQQHRQLGHVRPIGHDLVAAGRVARDRPHLRAIPRRSHSGGRQRDTGFAGHRIPLLHLHLHHGALHGSRR